MRVAAGAQGDVGEHTKELRSHPPHYQKLTHPHLFYRHIGVQPDFQTLAQGPLNDRSQGGIDHRLYSKCSMG
jgi:hypothetical protein